MRTTALFLALAFAPASAGAGPSFKKVMIVVLENESVNASIAQPYLAQLAKEGAFLSDFHAETHPSQPNYIALTAGTTDGVPGNGAVTLDIAHIGDLLEAKGKTWKVYAEGYPGNCFLGAWAGAYARKHVPFLSYKNVQTDAKRCANVVEAGALDADAAAGALPDYSLYIPDNNDNGHDTGVAFADAWLKKAFGPRLKDAAFMKDLLFVVTFDEGRYTDNRVYTALVGAAVKPGAVSNVRSGHYDLLRTIEDVLGLGTLGKNDAKARAIDGIWDEGGL